MSKIATCINKKNKLFDKKLKKLFNSNQPVCLEKMQVAILDIKVDVKDIKLVFSLIEPCFEVFIMDFFSNLASLDRIVHQFVVERVIKNEI